MTSQRNGVRNRRGDELVIDGTTFAPNAREELFASLCRIVRRHSPTTTGTSGGFYHGALSIALLLYRVVELYPDEYIDNLSLKQWFIQYLSAAENATARNLESRVPRKDDCGVMNDVLALLALRSVAFRDVPSAKALSEYSTIVCEDRASNEWLYGRAGYLYLLRLASSAFQDLEHEKVRQSLRKASGSVVNAILDAPRPWRWHHKVYVGAVHGIAGITAQVVLTDPNSASKLGDEVDTLLNCQFASGNWPSSLPSGSDRLVQFCHGSPGVIASLASISEHFMDRKERIESCVTNARRCIIQRGVLAKEACLCHGTSGNALSLGGEDAVRLLLHTTTQSLAAAEQHERVDPSDNPEGLFTGEAGRAWAWAVMDQDLPLTFLGFNDV